MSRRFRHRIATLARPMVVAFVSITAASAADDARIAVRIADSTGDDLPARAWVDAAGRRLFEPLSPPTATPYPRDRSFSCDGRFVVAVPPGVAVVHVERGKEYRAVDRMVELASGESREIVIMLERWVDMPSEGWYSGDMHVHFGANDVRVVCQLALADDVHVTPAFTYWMRGTEKSWPGDWPSKDTTRALVADATHLVTRDAIEIERINGRAAPGASVGATFLFNLRRPLAAERFGEHFPTDATLVLDARKHSPDVVVDTDKPSWAETAVGAALGVYDTMQLCHNHYHREQTLVGGWGMIGPIEAGESNAAAGDGLFHRTNALYYRFLNCGFRIGVSGGSAIGVMAVPTGYNRVYAKVDGSFSAAKFWAAIKAGRSFATSGPLLDLEANGQGVGATIERDGDSAPIEARARVRAVEVLEALEIVRDGVVVKSISLRGRAPSPVIDQSVSVSFRPSASGWIAARALFRAPDGMLRQAHTSPIYVVVDGKPVARRADAVYMMKWIDRLVEVAKTEGRFPTAADRDGVLEVYARARAVYESIARRANG